jgi:antitoxin MazE
MSATKIQRWGNSLAVRLPRDVIRKARLGEGLEVEVEAIEEGKILVRGVHRYSLDELLARIDRDNLHEEVDSGSPVGREAW